MKQHHDATAFSLSTDLWTELETKESNSGFVTSTAELSRKLPVLASCHCSAPLQAHTARRLNLVFGFGPSVALGFGPQQSVLPLCVLGVFSW